MARSILPACAVAALLFFATAPEARANNFDGQPPPLSAMPPPIQRPPAVYRLGAVFQVHTMPSYEVVDVCHALGAIPADTACELNGVAYMPNPCEFRGDRYADLLCHEQGHVEGWPGNHPREDR